MTHLPPDVKGTVFEDPSPELTRVYADALLQAATAAGTTEAVVTELEEFQADLWEGMPGFAAMLSSPAVDPAGKDRILSEALEGRAEPLVLNFLRVLNRNGRLEHLPSIVRGVRSAHERSQNRRVVEVKSAVPLDDDQVAALTERLRGALGTEPILRLRVDPALIGGLTIQAGDQVIDASVRSLYLDQFRKRLIQDRVHEVLAHRDQFGLG